MRMWMIDPTKMCNQHLLGEHVELHMLVGSLKKGRSIAGFAALVEVSSINSRHAELATEMESRGMVHKSPLTSDFPPFGSVDRAKSLQNLVSRCEKCAQRNNHQERSQPI